MDGDTPLDCVVVGGAGDVGRLVVDSLPSGARVGVLDGRDPRSVVDREVEWWDDDATDLGSRVRRRLGEADLGVLCIPEDVATAAVAAMSGGGPRLLVDTLSVKSSIVPAVGRHAASTGCEALSVNPMFAPSLGWRGRPVAVVEVAGGEWSAWFLSWLGGLGAEIVPVPDGAAHDRVTGVVQTATHAAILALGQVLADVGADELDLARKLAPPPHQTMLAMLARIVTGTPETYWDVQASNAAGGAARAGLRRGLDALDALVDAGDTEGFTALQARLAAALGPDRDALATACARVFAELGPDRAAPPDIVTAPGPRAPATPRSSGPDPEGGAAPRT